MIKIGELEADRSDGCSGVPGSGRVSSFPYLIRRICIIIGMRSFVIYI
jgi:hypothetical protein